MTLGLVSERLNAGLVFRVIFAGVFLSRVTGRWRRGRGGVEVMDLFMLCSPSMAERYEGRSYGCPYITLWDPRKVSQLYTILMLIYQDGP